MVVFERPKRHCATGGEAIRRQTEDDGLERGRGGVREGDTRVRTLFALKRGRPHVGSAELKPRTVLCSRVHAVGYQITDGSNGNPGLSLRVQEYGAEGRHRATLSPSEVALERANKERSASEN